MSKKRAFILHGWGGHPYEGWFPWLKNALETRGFEVSVPQLMETENPRIYNWVPQIAETVGTLDENCCFIGHSMGCQAIARYLESYGNGIKVSGAVFVAGFFKRLMGLEEDLQVQETDKHWLESPVDLLKIKSHLKKSVAFFSDNDPWVPLDNQDDFRNKIGSEVIIVNNMGHFSGSNDIFELPIVLDEVLKLTE